MSTGQGTGAGTGAAPVTNTAQTALLAKIGAGKNPRARMQTTLHGIESQLKTAVAGGLPAVQTWLAGFNGKTIDGYCDAMSGSGEGE